MTWQDRYAYNAAKKARQDIESITNIERRRILILIKEYHDKCSPGGERQEALSTIMAMIRSGK